MLSGRPALRVVDGSCEIDGEQLRAQTCVVVASLAAPNAPLRGDTDQASSGAGEAEKSRHKSIYCARRNVRIVLNPLMIVRQSDSTA